MLRGLCLYSLLFVCQSKSECISPREVLDLESLNFTRTSYRQSCGHDIITRYFRSRVVATKRAETWLQLQGPYGSMCHLGHGAVRKVILQINHMQNVCSNFKLSSVAFRLTPPQVGCLF